MKAVSVYQLVHYLKGQLDCDEHIQNILVSGEISNFTHHSSGHLYFSIKDDKARISCVMFRSYVSKLLFKPKNGDKVILKANTSLFESGGQLQLYVSEMKIDGIGDLYLRYEALKNKLYNEGLFDPNHKKIRPLYPMNIAVLVGDKSAALSDIKTCFKRRWPIANVDIYSCLVQGDNSSDDIISKLQIVDKMSYDIIILSRGGGSIEDLWSFNNEQLARVIYNLNTFIISGVGHEQDFTIVDFVADLRAPTPTAAVELITPNLDDVINKLVEYQNRMNNLLNIKIKTNNELIINNYRRLISAKTMVVNTNTQKLDYLMMRLMNFKNITTDLKRDLSIYDQRIKHAFKVNLNNKSNIIKLYSDKLNTVAKNRIKDSKYRLKRNEILLNAYSSQKTLDRGYTISYKDDQLISSINKLNNQDMINIIFKDGKVNAIVKEIIKNG